MAHNTNGTGPKKQPSTAVQHAFELAPASNFTMKELTDIYNETRMDYVVPMPMSQTKLKEYATNYDVDLEHSIVVVSSSGQPFGLGMLGVRGKNSWITRLGVTPNGRQKGVGRAMMNELILNSEKLGMEAVILEVIKKNKPARRLFESLEFETLRELLVIRRPPKPMADIIIKNPYVTELGHHESAKLLESRSDDPSWVTATESMLNAGKLSGLVADFPDLGRGWIVYQNSPFQLSRVVVDTGAETSLEVATSLLQHMHARHPLQDTVVENIAASDKHWPAFQALGYLISFIRVEMVLQLTPLRLNRFRYKRPFAKSIDPSTALANR